MRSWVDAVSSAIPARAARLLPAAGPLILTYHGIGGEDGVAPAALERQLELVSRLKRVVPLADAIRLLGCPQAAEVAALTFDDGYRDFAELAVPALAALDLHATLFVPAGHIGGRNRWDEGRRPTRRLLAEGELRNLDKTQVEIGGHGLNHVPLAGLGPARLRKEAETSRRILEDVTAREVRLFAYPYGQRGDFDIAAERAVEAAGYTAACSTCFGRGSTPSERYRLRRVSVVAGDDEGRFLRKLQGHYDWVAAKEALAHQVRGGLGRRSR